ncbi:putative protein phosphatase 2C T23F11.1 [Dirofilaria immitis]|nr:putative protein phosphatase 2C T23F11.1 [Dirofilaria immitis]
MEIGAILELATRLQLSNGMIHITMGQTLSEPVTTKETASCANPFYKIGSSCMQGWRINMEDAHIHLLAVPDDTQAAFLQFMMVMVVPKGGNKARFLALDEKMRNDDEMRDDMSGTTAVVVLIKNKKIYCGNVGDSRAVACVSGAAHPLSFDHKPANENEARRIVAAGGWVEFNRVNACPDVTVCDLTYDHEFIILACDGIWDVMSNQEVIEFCRDRLAAGCEPEAVCEELLSKCLAPDCQMGGLGCDNMTAVLVCLLQEDTPEAYVARCSRKRVESAAGDITSLDGETFVTPQPSPIGIESNEELLAQEQDGISKLNIMITSEQEFADNEKPSGEYIIHLDKTKSNENSVS